MAKEIVVNFTPTGLIPLKSQTPYVPISVNEIVDEVFSACEIGITTVHLHVRNDDGSPSNSYEKYGEIIGKIRKYNKELVICVSLSGRYITDFNKRTEPLRHLTGDIKPDMGSLTLSSLNFNKEASINSPDVIKNIAILMNEYGIKPELEAFDSGMINYAKYLIRKGILTPPYFFNLIFGNIACAQATLLHAGLMINDLPENSYFTFGGIGGDQLRMNSVAISIGAGIRIGLEDNIWFDSERTMLAQNSSLIERAKKIIEANECIIMPSVNFRKMLNLKEGNGHYGTKRV